MKLAEPSLSDDLTRKERLTCKARPENSKGNGGSRPFVPWCDRKS